MSKTIYTPGQGLGDNWYTINKLLRTDEKEVYLSRYSRQESARRVDVKERLEEILPLIKGPIERIKVVSDKPTNYKTGFHDLPWDTQYYPTYKIWMPGNCRVVCYQFDGRFMKEQGGLPDTDLIAEIVTVLEKEGFKLIPLGLPQSLLEVVENLAYCGSFIGTCSGISHVAHSVGTPICLVAGGVPFDDYHANKKYFLAKTVKEVLSFVEQTCGSSSAGRAAAFQAAGRGFGSRLPF